MNVNVINKDGEISLYCVFSNEFSTKYNLITLCMQLHKNNNILDEKQRQRYEHHVIESGKHCFFEFNGQTYIARL